MPRCLVIQHVTPEGPYAIGTALTAAGLDVDLRRLHLGEPLPADLSGYAGLVVMGGPMSAAHDDGFPSRRAELTLLRDALDTALPTLGVCLGAQLLAAAAGAVVYRGPSGPEIGWAPVHLHPEAQTDPLLAGMPAVLDVLHWHGDTFELPRDAVRLASSPRYANQAFRLAPLAWGLQFHVEVTATAVAAFVDSFADELDAAHITGGSILVDTAAALGALGPHQQQITDRFARLVVTNALNLATEVA